MNILKVFRFIDKFDDTETDIVCESFDTAMLYWCHYYDFFEVEEVNFTNEYSRGMQLVEILGTSAPPLQ